MRLFIIHSYHGNFYIFFFFLFIIIHFYLYGVGTYFFFLFFFFFLLSLFLLRNVSHFLFILFGLLQYWLVTVACCCLLFQGSGIFSVSYVKGLHYMYVCMYLRSNDSFVF